jgi:hypothetical protein
MTIISELKNNSSELAIFSAAAHITNTNVTEYARYPEILGRMVTSIYRFSGNTHEQVSKSNLPKIVSSEFIKTHLGSLLKHALHIEQYRLIPLIEGKEFPLSETTVELAQRTSQLFRALLSQINAATPQESSSLSIEQMQLIASNFQQSYQDFSSSWITDVKTIEKDAIAPLKRATTLSSQHTSNQQEEFEAFLTLANYMELPIDPLPEDSGQFLKQLTQNSSNKENIEIQLIQLAFQKSYQKVKVILQKMHCEGLSFSDYQSDQLKNSLLHLFKLFTKGKEYQNSPLFRRFLNLTPHIIQKEYSTTQIVHYLESQAVLKELQTNTPAYPENKRYLKIYNKALLSLEKLSPEEKEVQLPLFFLEKNKNTSSKNVQHLAQQIQLCSLIEISNLEINNAKIFLKTLIGSF